MRYNVALIVADDAPMDMLERMPYVSGLDEAVTFELMFLATPMCTPSRVTLLTGRHPLNHGIVENQQASSFDFTKTIFTALKKRGYTTSLIGKLINNWPFGNGLTPSVPGIDDLHAFEMFAGQSDYRNYKLIENGQAVEYGDADTDYCTDVFSDLAVDFVTNAPEPWFVQVSHFGPHPTGAGAGTWPASRHTDEFDVTMADYRRGNFNEADISDKPVWLAESYPTTMAGQTQTNADSNKRRAWQCLLSIDEQIEALKDACDSRDPTMWDRTVLIFMSDNSNAFGEHRLFTGGRAGNKGFCYEEAIRTGLIVKYPGIESRTEPALVSNIDIAPTIAEAAGAHLPVAPDGMSLIPIVTGAVDVTREAVMVAGRDETGVAIYPDWDAIRTVGAKYVELVTAEFERYDLVEDEFELVNIAGSSDNAAMAADLATLKAQLGG